MVCIVGIKFLGGGAFDFPKGIVIDNQDNVYVSGRVTQCSDNNGSNPYYSMPRIGDNNGIDYTFSNTSTSCLHMFITKFNTNGVFQWIHFAHAPVDSSVAKGVQACVANLVMKKSLLPPLL